MPKLASIFSRAHYNFLLTWAYSLTLFRMQGSMNMQIVNELINSCTCASTHAHTRKPKHPPTLGGQIIYILSLTMMNSTGLYLQITLAAL